MPEIFLCRQSTALILIRFTNIVMDSLTSWRIFFQWKIFLFEISVVESVASDQRVVTITTLSQLESNNALNISWLQLGGRFSNFLSKGIVRWTLNFDHKICLFIVTGNNVTGMFFLINGNERNLNVSLLIVILLLFTFSKLAEVHPDLLPRLYHGQQEQKLFGFLGQRIRPFVGSPTILNMR